MLATTIGVFIQSTFKEQLKVRYFTDSQITLYRLLNDPLTFRPWVSNRLRQIKEVTNVQDWYYIGSEVNVASDLSSRGCSLNELLNSKDYWHGPPFLCDPDHDYQEMSITAIQLKKNIKQILDEEKKIAKPACLSFGNPTFDCSQIEKGDASGSMIPLSPRVSGSLWADPENIFIRFGCFRTTFVSDTFLFGVESFHSNIEVPGPRPDPSDSLTSS